MFSEGQDQKKRDEETEGRGCFCLVGAWTPVLHLSVRWVYSEAGGEGGGGGSLFRPCARTPTFSFRVSGAVAANRCCCCFRCCLLLLFLLLT